MSITRPTLSIFAAVVFLTPALADAGLLDYTATLTLDVGSTAPFSIVVSGQIDVASDGSFQLPAGVFATTTTKIPPQTAGENIASIRFQFQNGVGSFKGPGNPGGAMGDCGGDRHLRRGERRIRHHRRVQRQHHGHALAHWGNLADRDVHSVQPRFDHHLQHPHQHGGSTTAPPWGWGT